MTEAIPEDVMKAARKAASKLLADITDRKGWRQEYDQFDGDVRLEIREAHTGIIARAILAERERWQDKVDGLEADLDSALDIIARRGDDGARTWLRLNYPRHKAAAIRKGDSNG